MSMGGSARARAVRWWLLCTVVPLALVGIGLWRWQQPRHDRELQELLNDLRASGVAVAQLPRGPLWLRANVPVSRHYLTRPQITVNGKMMAEPHLKRLVELGYADALVIWSTPGEPVSDAALALLGHCRRLDQLCLARTRVTDLGAAHLGDLRQLRLLDLSGTAVADAGLASVQHLRKLEELRLSDTRITDAGLVHLRRLRQLQKLNLAHTALTGTGLDALRDLQSLTTLNLADTAVDDAAMVHVGRLGALRWLDISRTRVTRMGLSPLRQCQELFNVTVAGTTIRDTDLADWWSRR